MKTPSFWYQPDRRPSFMLRILAKLYYLLHHLHIIGSRPIISPVKTLCVGNLTVGGGGKTPTIDALYHLLNRPDTFILTRGYGGKMEGPVRVNTRHHTAADIGDEAMLHARIAPVMVSHDRLAGARAIAAQGGKWILMDDGFQNRTLQAHINILVIDGLMGVGNGHLLPAGPLREPIQEGVSRAHALVLIGEDKTNIRSFLPNSFPIFYAQTKMDLSGLDQTKNYIAFAGLAWPDKFYNALRNHGVTLVKTYSYPDHYAYKDQDLCAIIKEAERLNASIVTTEKDAIKIAEKYLGAIHPIPLTLTFDNQKDVLDFLNQHFV